MITRSSASIFAILLVGIVSSIAQTVVIDTLRSPRTSLRAASTFPSIRVVEDVAVTEAINRSLVMDFIGVDPNTTEGDPLNELWGSEEGEDLPRIYGLSWSCERSALRVLTIQLSGEYCGAHCEGFRTHYLFDLRTGMNLTFDRIFTVDGLIAVNDSLARLWHRRISDHIQLFEDSLRHDQVPAETREVLTEAIEMFRNCREGRLKNDPFVENMVLIADRLRFTIARCSDHNNRELDDLDPLELDLSREWLVKHLQPEAREAFGW